MKSLAGQMAFYAAYHRDARNRATHFIGVPLIVLALFIPLAWPRFEFAGFTLTAAMALAALVLAYYLFLDAGLGMTMVLVFGLLVWIGDRIAALGVAAAWSCFGVLFVGGWIFQLAGHVFEGRRPALADNLFQVFIAPIFLCAEVFFALGYRPALQEEVRRRSVALASGTLA